MKPLLSHESRSSAVLKQFFSIPISVIEGDLRSVARDSPLLRSAERGFRRKEDRKVTAEEISASYHRRFLLGVQMGGISVLPDDLVLFAVTLPAFEIGEIGSFLSSGSGSLLEIGKFVIECEESGCFKGYQEAVTRSEEILTSIQDTLFTNALSRYGHSGVIELFENNRPLFDIRQEIGRRLISPDLVGPDERAFIEKDFLLRYGPEFVQEFTRRLDRHGLAFS